MLIGLFKVDTRADYAGGVGVRVVNFPRVPNHIMVPVTAWGLTGQDQGNGRLLVQKSLEKGHPPLAGNGELNDAKAALCQPIALRLSAVLKLKRAGEMRDFFGVKAKDHREAGSLTIAIRPIVRIMLQPLALRFQGKRAAHDVASQRG